MMMDEPFARAYPYLARWVTTQGWIEVGDDGMQPSRVRVLDEGGLDLGGRRARPRRSTTCCAKPRRRWHAGSTRSWAAEVTRPGR